MDADWNAEDAELEGDEGQTTLERTFDELRDSGQLPSPSGVGMAILCLTQREDCSLEEIANTIRSDPALTGRILKLANDLTGRTDDQVSNVQDAAIRLGTRVVSNVALGFTLLSANRTGRCAKFDYDRYWSWSLACGVAAQGIAVRRGLPEPAQLFTAGLLSRIGHLALASVHAEEYGQILTLLEERPDLDPGEVQRDHFDLDERETAHFLLSDWGLPEAFRVATSRYSEPRILERLDPGLQRDMCFVLQQAARLADYFCATLDESVAQLEALEGVREQLGIDEDGLEKLCGELSAAWEEWGRSLQVATKSVPEIEELRRAALEADEQATKARRTRRLRILAVDDDTLSLRVLARHLEQAGHEVLTAKNGKEALAIALDCCPHIVITDWVMPEMDGLDLCQALRRYESGRAIYVLVLTSREDEDQVVEAFDAGVDDYVTKPFRPKLLLARVRAGERVVRLQEQVARDKRLQREQFSKLAVLNRKLRAAAMTDVLTGLPNRRYAMRRLEEEWAIVSRADGDCAVILFDIDHFKSVNDQHGHDVGDLVLAETARVIRETTRDGDVSARIGGEEFLVICPDTDLEGARACAERVRARVEQQLIQGEGFSGHVTVSAGVTARSAACPDIHALLKQADEALYDAKATGRNRVSDRSTDDGTAGAA